MRRRGFSRETTITRDENGHWTQDGLPVTHAALARSFDSWVERAPDGRFCLANDINWAFVEIQGPPYFVRLSLELSGGRLEALDPSTLRIDEMDAIWCDVRDGRVPARFDSAAAVRLGDFLEEGQNGQVVLVIGDERWPLPHTNSPMGTWTPAKGHVESHRER